MLSLLQMPVVIRQSRGRERGQNGYLEITGKTRKRWRGHYYVYEPTNDGTDHRKHKAVILGLRSELTRKEASDALRQVIAAQSEVKPEKKPEMDFRSILG